jgi:hypothetical protein
MTTQDTLTANSKTNQFNVHPGSLYGQAVCGHTETHSKLGRLHAILVPKSLNKSGANLLLSGNTQGFKDFLRDIKQTYLAILTPTLPEEAHLKGPLLGLGILTSDTQVILVFDPASQFLKQNYQEWVEAGQVSIFICHADEQVGKLQTMFMDDVDANLDEWSHRSDWEPDNLKRIRQVIDAFDSSCSGTMNTVITSVLEMQDPTVPATLQSATLNGLMCPFSAA